MSEQFGYVCVGILSKPVIKMHIIILAISEVE